MFCMTLPLIVPKGYNFFSSSSWKYSYMILLLFVHSTTTANYDRYDFNCPSNRGTKAINAAFVKCNNFLI